MQSDRFLIQVDIPYLEAVGRAVYCFSYLEWQAVYCGEKIKKGYISSVQRKTAGVIASDILDLAALIADQSNSARYARAAAEFIRLVKRRNDLLHSNPATIASQQRLVRHGVPWEIKEIGDLSDEFSACAAELNDIYYNVL